MRLLNTPGPYSLLGIRNRALLSMLVTSGLTGMDLWRLRCSEFDTESGVIQVERKVMLNAVALEQVRRYLTLTRPLLQRKHSDNRMFLTETGRPMKSRLFALVIHSTLRKMGLPMWKDIYRRPAVRAHVSGMYLKWMEENGPDENGHRRPPDFQYRNRAILALLLTTDIQAAELERLRLEDLDLHAGSIRVMRETHLEPECEQRLRIYVEEARPRLVGEYRHDMMFASRNGLPLTKCRGEEIFNVLFRKAGIEGARFRTVRRSWKKIKALKRSTVKGKCWFSRDRNPITMGVRGS